MKYTYTYTFLDILCTTKNGDIELVRQRETGLLAVKKTVPVSLLPQYKKIRKICHRNLVQIYEVEQQYGQCIVIEEYVDGETLEELLEREGCLTEEQTAKYLYELCQAVCALHKQDIVHRDVNPNNIMITRDGILKLCDYNIAQMMGQPCDSEMKTVGTVGYAPPEQFGYGMTDVQTDIYAMGRTANKMLTGEESVNYSELESGTKSGEEPDEEHNQEFESELEKEAAQTSSWFKTILSQMLSLDKTDRYETVDMVLADLYLVLYEEYKESNALAFFAPNFRRTVYQGRPFALGFLYLVLGFAQYSVWKLGGCNGAAGRILCILAWLIFFDFLKVSRWLLRMSESQKWFRYVIGFALLLAPLLIEG